MFLTVAPALVACARQGLDVDHQGYRLLPIVAKAPPAAFVTGFVDRYGRGDGTCTIQRMLDGSYRCVPPAVGVTIDDARFSDEACRHRIAVASDACPADVLTTAGEDCGYGVARILEARRRIAPGDTVYSNLPGVGCVPQLADDAPLYEVGDEIPLATLAPVTREVAASDGSIAQMVLAAEGRPLQFNGWRDVRGGFDCAPAPASDGVLRCLPFTAARVVGFSDGACTTAAALGTSCLAPKFAAASIGGDACHLRVEVHELGAPADTLREKGTDGICRASALGPGAQAFAVGKTIAPERFAEVSQRSGSEIPGRLAVGAVVVGGVTGAQTAIDTEFDVSCSPATASDGVLRCVPRFALGYRYFADAGCSRPIVARLLGPSCGEATKARFVDSECPHRTHVVLLGAPHLGDVFVAGVNGGGCMRTTSLELDFVFNEIAEEVSPIRFVEMKSEVEGF